MNQDKEFSLFDEFPGVSTSMWEEKIIRDLKGADFRKKLFRSTDGGIGIKPFYRAEDIAELDYLDHSRYLKPPGNAPNGWKICQDIFLSEDLKEANTRIRSALKGGATAIRIGLNDSTMINTELISSILEDIPLDKTEIYFSGSLSADTLYDTIRELAIKNGVDPVHLTGSPGADPLGKMASTGIPIASFENLGRLVRRVKGTSPGMNVIDISGSLFHNAGSTLVEELAISLAMANEYMALLTSGGTDALQVSQSMILNLCAGPDYFMEIAKLRSARILWGKIMEAYGIKPVDGRIRIHSTSSEWNMTRYDPHMNILRGTTEAMSAILGGADILSILPFDYPYKKGNGFSDRIARNVQNILREEAYFDRVADPGSGSYYIESLTDSIGEKAWDLFREIESRGGFIKSFESGWIQEKVMASRKKKTDLASTGEGKLLGTNSFPDFNEMILGNLDRGEDSETDPGPGPGSDPGPSEGPLKPVSPFRLASDFERLRLDTERSGKRPVVYLFKYGDHGWRTARAQFSANFFACAGYEIIDLPAPDTVEAAIEKAKEANADIVVLCSSDETYTQLAPALTGALNKKTIIVVAGYPESADKLRKSGIEHFIHMKSHLLETLTKFNRLVL